MSGSTSKERPPRSTVDTNLFVSGLISRGAPKQLLDGWDRGDFLLVLSKSMAAEVRDVVRRPRIRDKYQLTDAQIERLEQGIDRLAEVLIELQPLPAGLLVRDPKDIHVLQTALTGQVDYLITGDGDLLDLDGHELLGELRIVTVNDFLKVLGSDR